MTGLPLPPKPETSSDPVKPRSAMTARRIGFLLIKGLVFVALSAWMLRTDLARALG